MIAAEKVAKALEKKDMKILHEYPREYEASFIGQEARRTVQIKDNISKVIRMKMDNHLKSVLTAMLELEIIQWDGKELPTALKYSNQNDLTTYAQKLIDEKEMKIKIATN